MTRSFFQELYTQAELNYYFQAKKSIPVFIVHNWDNPSSKIYVPSFGFEKTISWGKQMTNYLETSDSNFGELIEQFPLRLNI